LSKTKKKSSIYETVEAKNERLDALTEAKERANRPKSYGEYLKTRLADAGAAYAEAMRSAEKKRLRSLGGYGSRGESLAKGGLVTSGYADYLREEAERRFDGESIAAESALADEKEKGRRDYASYLEREDAKEDEILRSAIRKMASSGIESYEEGYRFGVAEGLSGDRAELFARMCDAYGNRSFRGIDSDARISLLREIMQNGLDRESAYLYARAVGASSATAKKIAEFAAGMREDLGNILH
jgi:hypothetical protein